jgi:hypothetical protein
MYDGPAMADDLRRGVTVEDAHGLVWRLVVVASEFVVLAGCPHAGGNVAAIGTGGA